MSDQLICLCHNVRKSSIIDAIENKGLLTLKEIQEQTSAGTACGCCNDDIEEILKLYLKSDKKEFNQE